MTRPAALTKATDFATLADRHKWIREHANDNRRSRVVGTRIERNLRKYNPELHHMLMAVCEILYPANDNQQVGAEDSIEGVQTRHEIRPSETELLEAAGWKRGRRLAVGIWEWERSDAQPVRTDNPGEFRLGDLVFRNGRLVEFGRTKSDGPRRPWVDATKPQRGGANKDHDRVADYLSLRGVPGLIAGHSSEPRGFSPLAGRSAQAVEAEQLLGIAWSNTDVSAVRFCYCFGSGVAKGYGRVTRANTTVTSSVEGNPTLNGRVDERLNAKKLIQAIGADAHAVLEDILDDLDYGDIGRRLGHEGAYARKAGRRTVVETIRNIWQRVSVSYHAVPLAA